MDGEWTGHGPLTIVSGSLEERPLNARKSAASPTAMCLPKCGWKNKASLLPKPQKFRINDSHSASSRKPRRRHGLGIGAEILFCLKKDWSGKPAPSGKPPNNEYPLIPNSSEIQSEGRNVKWKGTSTCSLLFVKIILAVCSPIIRKSVESVVIP